MNTWITSKAPTIQSDIPNKHLTLTNQLCLIDDVVYLVPRNTLTDNYTIPLGINKDKYDTRPSHLHDIACKYHEVIIVDLPVQDIIDKYIYNKYNKIICSDIPIEYLKVIKVGFNKCNNLLYNSMRCTDTIPKYKCKLYRFGVNFNINWLLTGKKSIDLNKIYNDTLSTI